MTHQSVQDKLAQPFAAGDIEWRVQRADASAAKPWAQVLAYVTNRAIQERLDMAVGIENWKNEFTTAPDGGVMCGISIRFGDEWVTKYDAAENTAVEAVKGGMSNAMKRAAVQWGIGRYLYNLDASFVPLVTVKPAIDHMRHYDKQSKTMYFWALPKLPEWALPKEVKNETN
jgi:hypothetical protein